MATSIPVPVEFQLPDGWTAAPPDEAGAPGAAFVALHPHPDDGFTANIVISGDYRTDDAPLETVADESVQRLEEGCEYVSIAQRTEVGSAEAPGLTQVLRMRVVADGRTRDLVQSQVYLSLQDVYDPQQRYVLQVTLTVTTAQFDNVIGDFQRFIATVRPSDATERGQAT